MKELKVISKSNLLGKVINVYGTADEPLFLAKDVAEWIEHSDVSMMLKNIDEEEKVSATNPNNACGGQNAWFLTEDGLYEVFMQSRKPVAKQFKKGVKAILREIRRTGSYGTPRSFAEALRLAADQQERIEAQQRQLEEQHPKVEYFDALVDRKLNLSFRDTAKEIGIRQNDFIQQLIQKKYIFRDAKRQLKPHAAYVGTLFVIKECKAGDLWAGNQTLVTPKGRETFNILFASH